ncbi:MAG: hypothetical protein PWP24_1257 [Clostridiales bacterium]|nr:hypothetical protein [Clostridiales bacterium]
MKYRNVLSIVLSLALMFQLTGETLILQAESVQTDDGISSTTKNVAATYAEGELLVTYQTKEGAVSHLPKGVKEERLSDTCSLFEVAPSQMTSLAWELLQDPDVTDVEPNHTVHLLNTNDYYSEKQWAFYDANSSIDVTDAWDMGTGKNQEVIVAVIDTGIDYLHADLQGKIWENQDETYLSDLDNDANGYKGDYYGWNFSDQNPVICDYEYEIEGNESVAVDMHGTHVAGIIDAVADNGIGIAGLASYSNVKLMSLKVMGLGRNGVISDIVKAIAYAEDNGATICNLSLGTEQYSKSLYQAMKNSSMLFVCAAGNGDETTNNKGYDISRYPMYPASYDLDNTISVANVNRTGELDATSCYSKTDVDIAAPGTDIASCYVDKNHTDEGLYIYSTGTSMAAPFVTATAALLSSYYGDLSALDLKNRILGGSKKVNSLFSKVKDGAYLDVYGALTYQGVPASVETDIKDINASNNKKYVVRLNNPLSEEVTLLYATGEKDVDYFEGGEVGTPLDLSDNKAVIKVTKTTTYTLYLLDAQGRETVYTDKVVVPKLTKVSVLSKKTLKKGDVYTLKPALSQEDVYAVITYESSKASVARVTKSGRVKALKKGTAYITVTATYKTKSVTTTCKIVVK